MRATVVPRIPVTYRGRRFQHGALRVRVLGPGPLVASAFGVTASASTIVVPQLAVSTRGAAIVGSPVARRRDAAPRRGRRGALRLARVDTRTAHVAHVLVRTRPAAGWAAVSESPLRPGRAAAPRGREPRPKRPHPRSTARSTALRSAAGRRLRRGRHRRAARVPEACGSSAHRRRRRRRLATAARGARPGRSVRRRPRRGRQGAAGPVRRARRHR